MGLEENTTIIILMMKNKNNFVSFCLRVFVLKIGTKKHFSYT